MGDLSGGSTVVITETPSKAREIGAKRLGVSPGSLEVIQHDDPARVIGGPDRPLTKEEADEIWNQGASAIPGSWEGI